MRRDWILIAAMAAAAFVVRTYPAWNGVVGAGGRVNFLETDAWYHVRLVENQVHNFPWRVTLDPYAAVGGQFVPIAPLYDTITSMAVVALLGRDASTASIERVAAFIPPILGTLAVITIWALGRHLFDRRAGLLAAAFLAILPGHFMDRTMLGFVDHHALEALLVLATLLTIAWGLRSPPPPATSVPIEETASDAHVFQPTVSTPFGSGRRSRTGTEVATGVVLGLYLLAWASGAFLLAILGAWLVLLIPLARTADSLCRASRVLGIASLIALSLVVAFQDPRMHRYGTQIIGLAGLGAIALGLTLVIGRELARPRKTALLGGITVIACAAVFTAWWLNSAVVWQVVIDLARLTPDPTRMGVLEARPLFLYPGKWNWWQPWQFFRTGFYIGLIALVPFALRVWRDRRPVDLLVWVFAVAMFAATIGQNRFGYYLVSACALLGGWLATRILDWGGWDGVADAQSSRPVPRARVSPAREVASLMVVGAMFAPNLAPPGLLMPRTGSLGAYWEDTMMWLRHQTPPPFATAAAAGDEYYLARYPRDSVPAPDYAVMSWWDQGYWIIQRARRVPIANPTQERAHIAARFFAETDEVRAREMLTTERVRFVLSDWELPFRLTRDRVIMGRFQNVLDWAGATHADYYEIVHRRTIDAWTPIWAFHEAYYRSMAYRLTVLGGAAAAPANSTTVITVTDRTDARGLRFREVLSENTYPTYEAALRAASVSVAARTMIVGLDPWRTAFPIDHIRTLAQVHGARTPEQKPTETPWVRVFEVK